MRLAGERLLASVDRVAPSSALMSTPMTSCPLSANCAARGRPILPRPMTAIFIDVPPTQYVDVDGAALARGLDAGIGDGHGGQSLAHGDDVARRRPRTASRKFSCWTRSGSGLAIANRVLLPSVTPRKVDDLVPLGRDQAVLVEGQVTLEGVGDERAALAGDDRHPLLQRGQPVDQVAGDGAVQHLGGDRDEVLVLAAALVGGVGRDRGVGRLDDPGGQVDVVGGQVLDDADVGDAVGEGALPTSGDLVDLAELALLEPRAQSAQSAGLQRSMWPTALTRPALLEGVDQLLRLARVGGERLLDRVCGRRRPRARARHRGGGSVGTATTAASMPSAIISPTVLDDRRPRPPCRACRRPGRRSPTSSTPSMACSTRAWLRPIMPMPTSPTRSVPLMSGTRLRRAC